MTFSAFQLHPDSDFQASRQRVSNGAREKRFSKTRRGTGINQIHSQDFLYYLTLRHSRHPAGRWRIRRWTMVDVGLETKAFKFDWLVIWYWCLGPFVSVWLCHTSQYLSIIPGFSIKPGTTWTLSHKDSSLRLLIWHFVPLWLPIYF